MDKNLLTEGVEDVTIKEESINSNWFYKSDWDWDIKNVTEWSEGTSRTRPRLFSE
jgi:hypothetical protein